MIEIGSLRAQSPGILPPRRQPQEGIGVAGEPVRPEPQTARPPLRVVEPPADPEQLILYSRRSRYADLQEQTEGSLRSRRALSAYGAMTTDAEREYFRSVMGIDEHV